MTLAPANKEEKQADNLDSDVRVLSSTLYFYKHLVYRTSVKTDEQSERLYRLHKTYLSKIKLFILLIYILVLPILDTPQWCIAGFKAKPGWTL